MTSVKQIYQVKTTVDVTWDIINIVLNEIVSVSLKLDTYIIQIETTIPRKTYFFLSA